MWRSAFIKKGHKLVSLMAAIRQVPLCSGTMPVKFPWKLFQKQLKHVVDRGKQYKWLEATMPAMLSGRCQYFREGSG